MIPYDELVVALQTWRARQGLPVAQLSGALTPPPVVAAPPAAVPARANASPSGSLRGGPPPAPAGRPGSGPTAAPVAPPPLAHSDETIDELALVDEAAIDDAAIDEHLAAQMDESHFGNDGDNFSIPFDARAAALAAGEEADESTSIGSPPARPSDMDATNPHGDPTVPRTSARKDDW